MNLRTETASVSHRWDPLKAEIFLEGFSGRLRWMYSIAQCHSFALEYTFSAIQIHQIAKKCHFSVKLGTRNLKIGLESQEGSILSRKVG